MSPSLIPQMVSFTGCSLSPVSYQEASITVRLLSDPMTMDSYNDKLSLLFPNTVLGPRLTLSIGSLGYSLYIGSLWW